MNQTRPNTIVNAWNEWDPMKHVIVGRPDGTTVQAPEPAISRHWPDDGFPRGVWGPMPDEFEAIAIEQQDNLVKVLEDRGIRVDRPTPLDFSQTVQTPDWVQESMMGCAVPRDLLLPVGNEILEATMSFRSRWYEYLCYRPLLEQYFREDPNFRWEAAPKPRLADASYRPNFWESFDAKSREEQLEHAHRGEWALTEVEPLFDAADVARCGKDLFVQRSMVTNAAGVDWLRRHFPDLRVHELTFLESAPRHIDGTLVPLRPGLALINPARRCLDDRLYELFKINDWELVGAATPHHTEYHKLSFCSPWLSFNTFMIDPKTVVCEEKETAQIDQFQKLGLDVVTVPFWEVGPFGGGLHCSTVEIYREGGLEDYFPKQIPGF